MVGVVFSCLTFGVYGVLNSDVFTNMFSDVGNNNNQLNQLASFLTLFVVLFIMALLIVPVHLISYFIEQDHYQEVYNSLIGENLKSFSSPSFLGYIYILLFYMLCGMLIGWVYGKIKNKKLEPNSYKNSSR